MLTKNKTNKLTMYKVASSYYMFDQTHKNKKADHIVTVA